MNSVMHTKRTKEERAQHRRDKVRENVRRCRARKKERALAVGQKDVPSGPCRRPAPSSRPRQNLFVNKSAFDTGVDLAPPPAGAFLGHSDEVTFPLSTHHHWLTLLSEYTSSPSTSCLVLVAHAISLRAAAAERGDDASADELLRQSQFVYGAALKELRVAIAARCESGAALDPTTALATTLALAQYELCNPDIADETVERWAKHVNGLDFFLVEHRDHIIETDFGSALVTCWAAQRAWRECLVASGVLAETEAYSASETADSPTGPAEPSSPSLVDTLKDLCPDDACWLKYDRRTVDISPPYLMPSDNSDSVQESHGLRSGVLSIMLDAASILRAANCVYDKICAAQEAPPLVAVKAAATVEARMSRHLEIVQAWQKKYESFVTETLSGKDGCHDRNASEGLLTVRGMEAGQLRVLGLAAQLVVARARVLLAKSKPDHLSPGQGAARVDQIEAEILALCQTFVADYGFLGHICAVLPRALVWACVSPIERSASPPTSSSL